VTFGFFLSHSSTTDLNTASSRALQPTQIEIFVGDALLAAGVALELAAAPATTSASAVSTTTAVPTRLMKASL